MLQRMLRSAIWGALVAVLTVVAIMAIQNVAPRRALETLGEVPPFTLTERNGAAVTLDDLRGDAWIADFIFTRCASTCPIMTARLIELRDTFSDDPVRLVSISVDPAYDTPERLRAYADRYAVNDDDWLFLTGDKQAIYTLIQQGFRLGVEDRSAAFEADQQAGDDGDAWTGGEPFIHSTRFVLVDADAHIRGYYDGTDSAALEQLKRDCSRLRREERDRRGRNGDTDRDPS